MKLKKKSRSQKKAAENRMGGLHLRHEVRVLSFPLYFFN